MPIKNNENGFTVIEVIIAILILTVGILPLLSAISYAALREREAEQRNTARQLTNAALESIFAVRDLQQVGGAAAGPATALDTWETAVANTTPATPLGVFLSGYNPIREDSGRDGIEGTADDACNSVSCVVGAYTNSSQIIKGYEREIIITNIFEGASTVSNRRRVVVNVRYFAGQIQRIETVSTILSKTLDN